MTRFIIPIAGIALLVASGVLYAMQTGHTRDPEVMAAAAQRVDVARDIQIEGWNSERVDIAEKQLQAAEAAGGGSVRYVETDGYAAEAINVMLLCGPHGPISVHPPTACFTGVGYRQVSPQRQEQIKDADGTVLGTFWVTEFEYEENGVTGHIRTWWAWSPGGPWQAPENPRMTFAGSPVLYKLYLTERIAPEDNPAEDEGGEDKADANGAKADGQIRAFAKQYLPRLQQKLASTSSSSKTETL